MWTQMGSKTDGYTKPYIHPVQGKRRKENEHRTKMLTFLFFLVATNELKFFIITFFRFALALGHQVC